MKLIILLIFILLTSCNRKAETVDRTQNPVKITDSLQNNKAVSSDTDLKYHSNARFRNVTVENVSGNKFRIKGEGQIFEANFNWVVEDGHNEIKKGYEATDAGAPEWGKFDFTIDVDKQRKNSTLTLILFEISAKDGSRQHELPIVLY